VRFADILSSITTFFERYKALKRVKRFSLKQFFLSFLAEKNGKKSIFQFGLK